MVAADAAFLALPFVPNAIAAVRYAGEAAEVAEDVGDVARRPYWDPTAGRYHEGRWRDPTNGRFVAVTEYYHATNTWGAENIRRSGIDLSFGRTEADFGQGFYVTKNRAQAQVWAERTARDYGGEPAILEFRVPRTELESLEGLRFAAPNEAWQTFVTAHRTPGTPLHAYDFVEGPVAANIGEVWVLHPDPTYHQLSIHTQRAAGIFWRGLLP
jgi:hypothetical protein